MSHPIKCAQCGKFISIKDITNKLAKLDIYGRVGNTPWQDPEWYCKRCVSIVIKTT